MSHPGRIAFIGNSLPRRCGIATFTTDIHRAVSSAAPDTQAVIMAMTDNARSYDYPKAVAMEIRDDVLDDYIRAATFLNAGQYDVVSLQHEFGIFGGDAGAHILALISRLTMPVVTTLHTILSEPTPAQRSVIGQIIAASSRIVVMAEKGRTLLREVYGAPQDKIDVIAHGIPDFPFIEPDKAKAKLGFTGRPVILTFGLISPNKGIEVMIDAMPSILATNPTAVYVVLGATHPNLVRYEGEAYRERLTARVRTLGIEEHVVFTDQFVDLGTLLDFISMCDVYVTPYLNAAQMTSGTLSYSFGLGKAVVSTPYWHARELLADGRGVLVPFADVASIGREIADLLTDHARRRALRELAYASSRSMTWERTAERYLEAFAKAIRSRRPRVVACPDRAIPVREIVSLDLQTSYFHSMCDDAGLFQHAVYSVPDRLHGYCVDDNARALLLACALNNAGEQALTDVLTSRFAAFIQHAWNPDTKYFRNFMSFDRRWLEDRGSEDSHGRTLWSLGECARSDISEARRRWSAALFCLALPSVEHFTSPRAWAFSLLGLDAYCTACTADKAAIEMRGLLTERLMTALAITSTDEWAWFEDGLSYDNARLPQALLVTGKALGDNRLIAAGLKTLNWLMVAQTAPTGFFRPVGSESFGDWRMAPKAFDQQPLEATAAISACMAAWRADGDGRWRSEAARAFAWFFGANDLGLALVDLETGSCCDGLHPDRMNENRGGESVVSYLLGVAEMRQSARITEDRTNIAPLLALRA